jgi:hypothetical protein
MPLESNEDCHIKSGQISTSSLELDGAINENSVGWADEK